jgi:AraC-like DNA-binding protein
LTLKDFAVLGNEVSCRPTSPKRYLAFARLARAARLLENRSATLAAVADELEYSSPQSFGRHVRMLLGVGAAEFRRTYDAARMLALFREELVVPYRERLRRFVPLGRV